MLMALTVLLPTKHVLVVFRNTTPKRWASRESMPLALSAFCNKLALLGNVSEPLELHWLENIEVPIYVQHFCTTALSISLVPVWKKLQETSAVTMLLTV
jgi:hypothetical protein